MKISLKTIIVPSIPLAILSIGFCFVLWMSSFFGENNSAINEQNNFLVGYIPSVLIPSSLVFYLVSFLFNLLNAFLLVQINNRFTLIRTRTFLPIFIFLLLMGSWDETHTINGSHISLTLSIFSLFYFFGMYRNLKASEQAFMGSLMLGVVSLLIQPFIFLVPVCWIGFMMFQSFSLRTFLASIFGALAPWTLYLGAKYFLQADFDLTNIISKNLIIGIDFTSISLERIIYFVVLSIVLVINLVGLYSNAHSDAMNTRVNLNFLILLLFSVLILILLFSQQVASFLPITALIYSILVSHAFTLKQNNFYGYVFIIFFSVNIIYIISKFFIK